MSSTSFGQDLLKISPENQMMGYTHQLAYTQQNSPPAPSTNPTVSMSRLNPRAPDFSVSYAKQQQHQPQPQQQTQQQQQIFHPQQATNPTITALALANNMTKQYHRPTSNGHARWSYGPVPQGYQPQGQEMVGMFNHNVLPTAVELLSNFENGGMVNSPSMSPSSPANNPTGKILIFFLIVGENELALAAVNNYEESHRIKLNVDKLTD